MYQHFFLDVSLSQHCTYRTGGKARCLAKVFDVDGLLRAMELPGKKVVLGRGSKVLISDDGFDGVALLMCGSSVRFSGAVCYADAGVGLVQLSRAYESRGLTGLEWASGIPASIGGALKLNAGAYGSDMSDVVLYADVLRGGRIVRLSGGRCGLGYRSSGFYPSDIIVGAGLKAEAGDKLKIAEKMAEFALKRSAAQPLGRSCGSVFKANQLPAYRYILEAGLSGLQIGGARISDKHANFILNDGDACSSDIYALIQTVKAEVFVRLGVRLEEEVVYIGEF